ncbi:multidrug efflux SMR transporter [Rhodococcus spelaei]|uniref:Multidrug resistance protein Mmr n=1 Tax=Rhodococcus spelaei TaxID=2546320 RepID=A0A541BN09_9NOCA|nr:multidrug efflux SMR transporter [Rhodococcus spelaei]
MAWFFLFVAISAEVLATSLLPRTEGFRRPVPTAAVLGLYSVALYLLSKTLRTLDVGVAYAVWAGVGTAAVAAIGMLILHEPRSASKVLGIGLVVAGVVALNVGGLA